MSYTPDDRFAWFLEEFGEPQKYKEVTDDIISRYKHILPDQLLTYWREYGFCSFKGGLFSIVDPTEYLSNVKLWLNNSEILKQDTYHVIARSGFGDLLMWGENNGNNYKIDPKNGEIFSKKGDSDRIKKKLENEAIQGFFATKDPETIDLDDVDTDKPIFADAVKKFGALEPDEMFTFEPALFMGGEQTLAKVNKVNIHIQLELLAKMGTPQVMDINGLAKKAFS